MTIDERLERLTERHEALAESLQLLKATVDELGAHVDSVAATVQVQAELTSAQFREVKVLIEANADVISQLVRLVENHEQRSGRLEGGNQAA